MLGQIRGEVRFKESLSYHTSLRLGGPADVLIAAQTVDDIRHAVEFAEREQLPLVTLGGGNSVLVTDHGIRGVVLKLDGALSRAQFHGEEAVAGGGMSLSALLREAAGLNLGGLECLAGIPASVGGALATNAGTDEGRIGDLISAVYYVHPDGTLGEVKRDTTASSYWTYEMPAGAVAVGCRLQFHRRPQAQVQKEIQQRMRLKKAAQPLALASAGMIWKNPPGEFASKLLEKVGLRGRRIGGAEISEKDTNFIVNRGTATVADIRALMDLARERVSKKFGIALEPAIRVLGEDR
jgi:UDP-N-acetylmuramate dehydrogenase